MTASGSGRPPATVDHTYAAGDFTASLSVTDTVGQTNLTSLGVLTARASIVHAFADVTSTTGVTVYTTIDPNGLDTTYEIGWGTTAALGQSTTPVGIGLGTAGVRLSAGLSGLTPGTTYDWRVRATNAAGTVTGPLLTFRTQGHVPNLTLVSATVDSPSSATLVGDVNPGSLNTHWYFEYGPTSSYGSVSPASPGAVGSGANPVTVSTHLVGLAVATAYHFALVATNGAGTITTGDQPFRTPDPPAVGHETSTRNATSAKLFASVDPEGLATTYVFRWGSTASLDHETPVRGAGSGIVGLTERTILSGLHRDATYHWDVVATNAAGTTTGPVETFTTS